MRARIIQDMDIGTRLDEAMRDAKIESQSQLARMSGVPQATISRILKGSGKQGPETATLMALAQVLSIELRWLQQGLGPKRPGQQRVDDDEARGEARAPLKVVETVAEKKLQWVSDREADLLSEFRACAEPQQERLLAAARGLPKSITNKAVREKA